MARILAEAYCFARTKLQLLDSQGIQDAATLHAGCGNAATECLERERANILMTPWPALVAIMAPIAARLSDRYPPALLGRGGLLLLGIGMASLAMLRATQIAHSLYGGSCCVEQGSVFFIAEPSCDHDD